MNIVFMGTGDFSLKALEKIFELEEHNIIAVYTQAPKPSGRNQKIHKSAVHQFSEAHNITVFTPKSLRKHAEAEIFAKIAPDLAIVSSYGLIIPQNILDIPRYGFINIHASALPRWRGAAPIQAAILAGDQQTGITIMKIDAGVDTGDIISMQKVNITAKTNYGELSETLGNLGAKMIVETLENLEENLKNSYKQPEDGATYAPKISKEDCRINWNKSANEILRQIMALAPNPAAWSELDGLRVKILDANLTTTEEDPLQPQKNIAKPEKNLHQAPKIGEVMSGASGKMFVKCGEGVLEIAKIQPAGKNVMSGNDFLRGRANCIGKTFL